MERIATLNRVLDGLARRYRIAHLQLGALGTVGLKLQDGVDLTLEYVARTDRLFIYTVVAQMPDEEETRAQWCERMLEMNCLEHGTFHGTLALDGTRDEVLYQTALAADGLTEQGLDGAIQTLLAHRQPLMDRLKSAPERKPAASSSLARLSRFFQCGGTA